LKSHLDSGKLVLALDDYKAETWPVSLIYASGRRLPLKMRAFLDFTIPRLKGKLPQA
jgi:DNA-binding transcriptional LysR family regulator